MRRRATYLGCLRVSGRLAGLRQSEFSDRLAVLHQPRRSWTTLGSFDRRIAFSTFRCWTILASSCNPTVSFALEFPTPS